MLVLSRKIGETIRIGGEIELVVLDVSRGRVKLGFAGPRDVQVRRGELADESRQPATEGVAADAAGGVRAVAAIPASPPLRYFRKATTAAAVIG